MEVSDRINELNLLDSLLDIHEPNISFALGFYNIEKVDDLLPVFLSVGNNIFAFKRLAIRLIHF